MNGERRFFESIGIRVNLGKTKLIVRGMEIETFGGKVDLCDLCGTRVMSNSMLYTLLQHVVSGSSQDAQIRTSYSLFG